MNKKNLKGKRFGRLLVLEDSKKRTKSGSILWLSLCDCGNLVKKCSSDMIKGHTKSCGCLNIEIHRKISLKHGDRRGKFRKLYQTWIGMKRRCHDENRKGYKYYGAKGIKVCPEWENNFSTFKFWALLNGYEEGLTIDRINAKGNYEPNNCQWLTKSENSIKGHLERRNEQSL